MALPSPVLAQPSHPGEVEAKPVKHYANLDGHSGVSAYEIRPGEIRLRFVDRDTIYVYTGVCPGAKRVREMQRRAEAGKGLATYVNRHVRDDYEYAID
jgi:hypothetical protein